MDKMVNAISLLPALDWLALAWFFSAWVGYALFARHPAPNRSSILAATNRVRRQWMLRTTYRDNRVFDGVVVQNLSTSPSFFASTTILIIGGLLAALGANDKAQDLVRGLPFAAATSVMVFDLKLVVLSGIFVHAFFRFTWSMRQYTFGALLVASAPQAHEEWTDEQREAFANRAGRMMGLAAETFNDGLRAYYMSFAVIAWFFSAWAFIAAVAGVVWVLYMREFNSEVPALMDG